MCLWVWIPLLLVKLQMWCLFKQGLPWHSSGHRVYIHSETRSWHDIINGQSFQFCLDFLNLKLLKRVDAWIESLKANVIKQSFWYSIIHWDTTDWNLITIWDFVVKVLCASDLFQMKWWSLSYKHGQQTQKANNDYKLQCASEIWNLKFKCPHEIWLQFSH